jgi:biopolymer transport protein ExbD
MAKTRAMLLPVQSMNATPLMDVMLVLLVIFMVVTPLISHDTGLLLPQAFHADEEDHRELPAFRLDVHGVLTLGSDTLTSASLGHVLETLKGRELVVEADRRLPMNAVSPVLDVIAKTGFRETLLVSQRPAQ